VLIILLQQKAQKRQPGPSKKALLLGVLWVLFGSLLGVF